MTTDTKVLKGTMKVSTKDLEITLPHLNKIPDSNESLSINNNTNTDTKKHVYDIISCSPIEVKSTFHQCKLSDIKLDSESKKVYEQFIKDEYVSLQYAPYTVVGPLFVRDNSLDQKWDREHVIVFINLEGSIYKLTIREDYFSSSYALEYEKGTVTFTYSMEYIECTVKYTNRMRDLLTLLSIQKDVIGLSYIQDMKSLIEDMSKVDSKLLDSEFLTIAIKSFMNTLYPGGLRWILVINETIYKEDIDNTTLVKYYHKAVEYLKSKEDCTELFGLFAKLYKK